MAFLASASYFGELEANWIKLSKWIQVVCRQRWYSCWTIEMFDKLLSFVVGWSSSGGIRSVRVQLTNFDRFITFMGRRMDDRCGVYSGDRSEIDQNRFQEKPVKRFDWLIWGVLSNDLVCFCHCIWRSSAIAAPIEVLRRINRTFSSQSKCRSNIEAVCERR